MMEAFLLNPPRHRRKARRSRNRGRRKGRGNFGRRMAALRKRKKGRGRRRNSWKGSPVRHRRAARKGIRRRRAKLAKRRKASRSRRRGRGRKRNSHRRVYGRRRRRNPGRGSTQGLGSTSMFVAPEAAHLSPIEFTMIPAGFGRTIAKSVTGALVAGAAGATSFFASSLIVDALWDKDKAAESNYFGQKLARPLLFAASAGVLGFAAAKLFKKPLLTAAVITGAGIRALAGLLALADRPKSAGVLRDLYDSATGMSDDDSMEDYLQVGDYLQVEGSDGGDGSAGDSGVGAMYEAGMGDMYEAGMGYDYHEENVEQAAAPF